tara:strand:+ start:1409 stop:1528 length:120 start_codon:yes stop_codon:yes gene_type:complete
MGEMNLYFFIELNIYLLSDIMSRIQDLYKMALKKGGVVQ